MIGHPNELSIEAVTFITHGLSLRYNEAQREIKACRDLGLKNVLPYWLEERDKCSNLITAIRERGLAFIEPNKEGGGQ